MKNVFIYGMSGSGKDTISNYLRDKYDYLKLRIAGTIKQYVYETYGFKSQEEFEKAKRVNSEVRLAHNIFGNQYDKEGINRSGVIGSLNRIDNIINRTIMEIEISNCLKKKPICISDTRCLDEVEKLLNAGFVGIFLTRTTSEFKDENDRTEQSIILNGELQKLIDSGKYNNQIIVINNTPNPCNLNLKNVVYRDVTDGTTENLLRLINYYAEYCLG